MHKQKVLSNWVPKAILNKLVRIGLVVSAVALTSAAGARAQDPDQITAADVAGKHLKFTRINPATSGKKGAAQTLPGIAGFDSVPNFSGTYSTPGVDPNGNPQSTWFYNTLGNSPATTGTTTIGGPIVPVSVDMRNADGPLRFVRVVNGNAITCGSSGETGCYPLFFDATPFIDPILESPVFLSQITPAVLRQRNLRTPWRARNTRGPRPSGIRC
jgi:hypothetical protein